MKMARIEIEHFYGLMGGLFKICYSWTAHKLREEHPYALEQVRVSHLLTNCYVVVNGSIVTNSFKCDEFLPNSLHDYLQP